MFFWKLKVLCSEQSGVAVEHINAQIQTALSPGGGLGSAEDYLSMLMLSCDVCRRSLLAAVRSVSESADVSVVAASCAAVRAAYEYAEWFLTNYYGEWISGFWVLYSSWASAEYHVLQTAALLVSGKIGGATAASQKPPGADQWEKAVHRFPTAHFLWKEYILWVKALSHPRNGGSGTACYAEHCRRLFKRLINVHFTDVSVDTLAQDWLSFEQEHGTVVDIAAATAKCFVILKASLKQSVVIPSVTESHCEETAVETVDALDNKKRKLSAVDLSHSESVVPQDSKRVKSETTGTVVEVRNLPFTTTEAELGSFMDAQLSGDCGTDCVVKVSLVLSKAGLSRGIAHVKLNSVRTSQTVLALLNQIEYCGRKLVVEELGENGVGARKATNPGKVKFSPAEFGSDSAPHLTTVFVSRLPRSLTNNELKEHFSACGEVLCAKVARDKKTGESKVR